MFCNDHSNQKVCLFQQSLHTMAAYQLPQLPLSALGLFNGPLGGSLGGSLGLQYSALHRPQDAAAPAAPSPAPPSTAPTPTPGPSPPLRA